MAATLESAGFKKASATVPRRLIVGVYGLDKTGKTHFALTAARMGGVTAFINLNKGAEGVVGKFVKEGHDIRILDIDSGSQLVSLNPSGGDAVYQAAWSKFVEAYKLALNLAHTIIIDTESEAWELIRAARFGKLLQVPMHLYPPLNLEYQGLLNLAYDKPVNLVLIDSVKSEYSAEGNKTGKFERAGFSKIPGIVQVLIRCESNGGFNVVIERCRQNSELQGLEMPDLDFPTLLEWVHGGV
jgi:hypothetical protein